MLSIANEVDLLIGVKYTNSNDILWGEKTQFNFVQKCHQPKILFEISAWKINNLIKICSRVHLGPTGREFSMEYNFGVFAQKLVYTYLLVQETNGNIFCMKKKQIKHY